jgi:beta-glucanase (GH16 family)
MPRHQTSSTSQQTEVIFFDDFTSPELDRSVWNVEVTGQVYNNEQQAYIDSSETLYIDPKEDDQVNGVLVIHPRYRKGYITPQGKSFDFISARIHTRNKVEFAYGSVAARIWLPEGVGLWPAFWMLGNNGEWPRCGELDIMEYVGEKDWTSVAIHGPTYHGETPLVNKKFFSNPASVHAWHVYSMEWSPDCIHFKVDEELVYRVTRPMVDFYGDWVFDQRHYMLLNFALGGIYPFKTNGIKTPYYGLPAETVHAIQRDEIKLLLDWVKVSRSHDLER